MNFEDERLPLLTLEEAHDVIDALVRGAAYGDDDAGRLVRGLAARVPSREASTPDAGCSCGGTVRCNH